MTHSLHAELVRISAEAKAREKAALSTPFVRGTKTVRIKTARLVAGDRVLTRDIKHRVTGGTVVLDAQTKTGAVVRAVERIEPVFGLAIGGHRAQRSYTVIFTDGTVSRGHAPVRTWNALDTDKSSSASRQHFIDTGAYLTADEVV